MVIWDMWERGYNGVYITRVFTVDTHGEFWYGLWVDSEAPFYWRT